MSHCRWKQSRAAAAALLTTWGLKRLTEPIVVAWLLAVCFSGSLIRRRKTEWAPQTAALLDLRPLDRIKWFPLLHRELLLPSVRLQLEPRLLFLAMFASGRNFRRFNGTWAIVHSLLYGTLPSFPQRARGGGGGDDDWGMCLKSIQNKTVSFMWPWTHPIYLRHWTLPEVEMNSDDTSFACRRLNVWQRLWSVLSCSKLWKTNYKLLCFALSYKPVQYQHVQRRHCS